MWGTLIYTWWHSITSLYYRTLNSIYFKLVTLIHINVQMISIAWHVREGHFGLCCRSPGIFSSNLRTNSQCQIVSFSQQETQRATYRAADYNVLHFWRIGQGSHFCLLIDRKNKMLPDNFRWILFRDFREKVDNVSANERPGGNLVFPIGLKNINLVEDVEILLPVKFCWMPFGGFRWEVENISAANQRQGRLSWFFFFDRPEKQT